jgi:hypothetical protein
MVRTVDAVFFIGSQRRRRQSEERWGRRREGGGRGALGFAAPSGGELKGEGKQVKHGVVVRYDVGHQEERSTSLSCEGKKKGRGLGLRSKGYGRWEVG